jgi:hypothetical protein
MASRKSGEKQVSVGQMPPPVGYDKINPDGGVLFLTI